ncbi:MAG: CDP-alcohol phosphatidyltransferase family protein [Bacilli bacterium]|nr:CDP-alcohol phosphatidyltransferase family protein [Bacilli bacterium]
MKFIKYVPNLITVIRILGAISLIFLEPLSVPFLVVYGVCGATDAVDGFIARKFHVESRLGSVLDTISDFSLYIIMIVKIFGFLLDNLQLANWILGIAGCVLRLISYGTCLIKYKKFSSVHTYLNKALGFMFFLYPFVCLAPNLALIIYTYVMAGVALLGGLEELLIHLISKEYNVHNKSIFLVKKNELNHVPTAENAE